jgi:TolA-binding protein
VIGVGIAAIAAQQWQERKELERQTAELSSRTHQLEQQVEEAQTAEQALRSETHQQETQIAQLRDENERLEPQPVDRPTCVDSDASQGRDAIYVRGTIEVRSDGGIGSKTDHCRLDQLVEFSCIENPPGSGFFIDDTQILDCPAGSRCVSGECLR